MIKKIEDWFCEQSVQKKLLYIGFGIAFVLVFALNHFFPIYADDMMYSVVKYGQTISLSENFNEIGDFLYYYYFNWGGRVVAHLFAHVLLLFNFIGQDILNSIVYCLLLFFIYRIAKAKEEHSVLLFVFITISVFYFTPSFLSSAIWKTGSSNYLWTTVLTLFFVCFYHQYYDGKAYYKNSYWRAASFFLLGIAAGWTNENLGPILFLIVGTYIYLISLEREISVPHWAVSGFIGVGIGCCLLILSPGNAVRAESEGFPSLFNSFGEIMNRLPNLASSYKYFMTRLIIIYLFCFVANYIFPKSTGRRSRIVLQSFMFFIAANLSIWITLLSPSFPPRAFMCTTVLTIVSIGMLYANIDFQKIVPKIFNLALLAALLIYASIDYITFLRGLQFLDKTVAEREKVIDEYKSQGKNNLVFERIHMDYRFEYTDFINYYKDYYDVDVFFLEKGDPRLDENK